MPSEKRQPDRDPSDLGEENARLRAEVEALRGREATLRRVIDALPGVVFRFRVGPDGRGSFTFISTPDGGLGGLAPERLLGPLRSLGEVVVPEDLPAVRASILRAAETRTPWSHEYRVRAADGRVTWVRGSAELEPPGADGTAVWNGMLIDITARKRAEEALRESEAMLTAAVESLPFDFWAIDASGRYVMQNSACVRNWGFNVGKRPEDADAPDDVRALWASNNARALAGEVVTGDVVYVIEGERRVFHQVIGPIRDGGEIRGMLGVNIDITERDRAERALAESEARLARAEALSLVMTAHVGLDGRFLKVPQSLCDLLGYPEEEMLGMRSQDVTHEDDVPADREQRRRLVRGEVASFDLEKRYRRSDGGVVWVYENCSVVTSEAGEPLYFLVYVRDITKDKRLEEQFLQAQKMEAIGRLAGGVAHDFNNILTAILGFVSVASGSLPHGAPAQAHLRAIRQSGERGGALTRQLLAFARKQLIEPKVVDLNDLLGRVESLLRRVIGEDVELATSLAPDLWRVRVDPGQIEQVLMNLAVNARDAMPDGGRLSIETANVPAGARRGGPRGDSVLVRVADTGTGMSEETLEHLFEPFYTTKERGKGTGLGLATCYGVVTQSGGQISVQSAPGRGAAFSIYLPRAAEPAADEGAAAPAEARAGEETVLVVEDEPLVRSIFVHVLRSLGYRVLEAPDGEEALRAARAHDGRVDLLVTDVVMPRMGGRQLAERLRAVRPELRVLYVSGYTEDEAVTSDVPEEGRGFLQKPFTPDALGRKVREVLDAPGRGC